MGRRWQSLTLDVLFLIGMAGGCGGGGSTFQTQPPPPPSADFTVGVSAGTVVVVQGGVSAPVIFSITAKNGFSGQVQITLSGLPGGVVSNPASPFTAAPGATTNVVFTAAGNASTGNVAVSAEAVSGSLTHSAALTLTIQGGLSADFPRTTFVRTDSSPAADNPVGEARHRHLVFDPAHQHLFVANRAMNRMEVISTMDQSNVAQIAIGGVTSAELSADGSTVWAGTAVNEIVAVDTTSLRVTKRYMEAGISALPSTVFDRPEEVLPLANGKCFVRLRQPSAAESLLALWDPVLGSLTNLTSMAPSVFQNGLGPMARSGDYSRVIAGANDSSGNVVVFAAAGGVIAGPKSLGAGSMSWVAANSDGSRFAVAFSAGGAAKVLLLDGSLNQVASHASSGNSGVAFSRDSNFIFVSELAAGAAVVTVLDGHDLHAVGQVPGAAIQGVGAQIEDSDETQMLFGVSNRGVSFIDAASPVTLSAAAPAFSAAPASVPSEGPAAGGTALLLSGQNLPADALLKIGTLAAGNVSVLGSTAMQATSPASVSNGPAGVVAYSPANHWLAIAPEAFSYGPKILRVLPDAGVSTGGDAVQITGYGFGSDPSGISVKIGGANAIVESVDSIAAITAESELDTTYPFPVERITLQTPPGLAGNADVVVTASSGSATAARSFQYVVAAQSYAKPGFFRFIQYDQKRQRVYLTNIDHADVFDLQLGTFVAPIQPPGGPPPNAGWRGLSMTPDGSRLVIADFGAQSVYLLDPDTGAGGATFVGGISGIANSGPSRVAATSTQTVFVSISAEGGSGGGCTSCLSQMNLFSSPPTVQPAPEPEVSTLLGAPLLQGNASGDNVVLAFGGGSGGRIAVWNATAPNQFSVSAANATVNDIASTVDGQMFAVQTNSAAEVHDSGMFVTGVPAAAELTQIPGRIAVPGMAMHPTGALLYQPFLTGTAGAAGVKGGVDITDARTGALRLRIILPQQFMTDVDTLHGGFLAIDENGQRLFAITTLDGTPQKASLTVVQLAAVPLAIGTVSASSMPVGGGAGLTIRGSGFQPGIKVSIGGKSAAANLVDMNTLTVTSPALPAGAQQLVLTSVSGEAISLDAALTAN